MQLEVNDARMGYMGWTRGVRFQSILGAVLACLLAASVGYIDEAEAAARTTGIELLSGVGYRNALEGPSVLIGAEIYTTTREGTLFSGIEETRLGAHLSDVLAIGGSGNTLTLGFDGEWLRRQGPFAVSLGGQAYYRRHGKDSARTVGMMAEGTTGRIIGRFRLDYVEKALATFPWFQKDLDGLSEAAGDVPFFRANLSVSASIIPAYRINWSQDVKWRRPVGGPSGTVSVTTGPELSVGDGRFAAQGGIVFDPVGIQPIWQVRYQLFSFTSGVDLQIVAATRSLDQDRPLVYGWLGVDGKRLGWGAAVRLEESGTGALNSSIFFSLHPKLR